MRFEWLAGSSAALVVGSVALFFGAHTTPRPTGDGRVMQLTLVSPEFWTTTASILLIAATGFLLGIPSLLPLVSRDAFGVGAAGMILIAVNAVLLAGLAMQLVLLRGLEHEGGVSEASLSAAMGSPMQQMLLLIAFLAFFAGELLLAWALVVARTVPRWVPWMFVGHVLGAGVTRALDLAQFDDLPTLLMVAGFVGTAMAVNRTDVGVRRPERVRTRPGHPAT